MAPKCGSLIISLIRHLGSFPTMLQRIDLDDQTSSGSSVQVTEEERRRITEALKQSLAPTTRINYLSQWKRWKSFAHENSYPVFAADLVHIADWITQRAADGRKPGTIRMGLAAVGGAHRQANVPNPAEDEGVRATMRGITRTAGRAQKQAAGLTAASLAAIRATACVPRTGRGGSLETTGTARSRGLLDIAMASLMRDGMLRRSEAACLTWGDLVEQEVGTGRLTVARSRPTRKGRGQCSSSPPSPWKPSGQSGRMRWMMPTRSSGFPRSRSGAESRARRRPRVWARGSPDTLLALEWLRTLHALVLSCRR